MKPRLVVAALLPRDVVTRAREEFDALVVDGKDDMTAPEAVRAVTEHHADAILFTNTLPLSAEAIAALPSSVKVGATSSVGYDHIDVAAAKARGLVVTNTPDVLTECTADHAFMMLLAAARRAYEYDRIMRNGWRFRIGQGDLLGVRVTGKTLGILGMGRIGRAMAQRARGFDMRVVYHARNRLPAHQEQGARYFEDFQAMLPECNFLSLHAPATPATDKIIDAQRSGVAAARRSAGERLARRPGGRGRIACSADLRPIVRRRARRVPHRTALRPAILQAGQRDPVAACRQRVGGDAQCHGVSRAGQYRRGAGRPQPDRSSLVVRWYTSPASRERSRARSARG